MLRCCFLESIDLAECKEPSTGAFVNHRGPVHGLQVHQDLLYTCSGDATARAYSLVVSMKKESAAHHIFSSSSPPFSGISKKQ